ncbi:MAG: phage tail tube protein [Bacillota bacterium]
MPLGNLAFLGLAKEVNWGTPVAATDYIPIVSENIAHEIEQIKDASLLGVRAQLPDIPGLETVRGDLVAEARPIMLGFLLRSALGDPATTGTGPYTHTFQAPRVTPFSADCFLAPYTLEVFRDMGQSFQIAGAIINTLQLAWGTDQKILRATAGIIAKQAALIAKTSQSFETGEPFNWNQGIIKFAANVADLGAASPYNKLEKANIKIDNKMEGIPLLNNTVYIGAIKPNDLMTCELDLTAEADLGEYNKFANKQYQAMRVTFTAGTDVFEVTLPKVKYTAYPVNVSGPGRIVVSIKAAAYYSLADAYLVQAKLTNSKASY